MLRRIAPIRNTVPTVFNQENCREQILRSLGQLPPFSPTLNRVLASLGHEDVSFSRLSDMIEKDTVLAGNILKVVNSALYGRRGTVNSVRHAVSLLGVNKLRNTVLGMSISRMWDRVKTPGGWSMKQFNVHSVSVALLSDLLAQRINVDYAEGAFVAGLMHDVGRLLIAVSTKDEYGEIMRMYAEGVETLIACERQVLGVDHAAISALALSSWNLPQPIQVAARYHHSPEDDHAGAPSGSVRLSAVVCAADEFVNHLGNLIQPKSAVEEPPAEAFAKLAGDSAEQIVRDFDAEFEALRRFF